MAAEGIEAEVIDVRSLKPLDKETLIRSVAKTGRVLIVHEAPITGGVGGELAAVIADSEALDYLDALIRRLAGRDIPIPYNRSLERSTVPQREGVDVRHIMPRHSQYILRLHAELWSLHTGRGVPRHATLGGHRRVSG